MLVYNTKKRELYYKKVIRLHEKQGLGAMAISHLVPLSPSTINSWINTFAQQKVKSNNPMKSPKPISTTKQAESADTQEVKDLKARIKQLEKALHDSEVKSEVLDEMINIAEAKFHLPIRKKPGAKQ